MSLIQLKELIRAVQKRMYCIETSRSLFKCSVIVYKNLQEDYKTAKRALSV